MAAGFRVPRYRDRPVEQRSRLRRGILLRHAGGTAGHHQVNHALHIGIEHRFNETFAVFARAASAFRTPNIDERVGVGAFGSAVKTFDLKIQTSDDVEGGFRIKAGMFEMQSSIYNMNLTNEIHFDR